MFVRYFSNLLLNVFILWGDSWQFVPLVTHSVTEAVLGNIQPNPFLKQFHGVPPSPSFISLKEDKGRGR